MARTSGCPKPEFQSFIPDLPTTAIPESPLATKAFILIETQVGKVRDVVTELRTIDDVQVVDGITGPYDVIALIESENMGAVADLVTGRIQGIPGVTRTITCVTAG